MAPPTRRIVRRQRKTPGSWAAGGPPILMTRVSTSRSGSPRSRGLAARQDVAHGHDLGIPPLRSIVNEDALADPSTTGPAVVGSQLQTRRSGRARTAIAPGNGTCSREGVAKCFAVAMTAPARIGAATMHKNERGLIIGGTPCIDSNVTSPGRRLLSTIPFLRLACLPEVVHEVLPGQRMQISEGFNERQVSSCRSWIVATSFCASCGCEPEDSR